MNPTKRSLNLVFLIIVSFIVIVFITEKFVIKIIPSPLSLSNQEIPIRTYRQEDLGWEIKHPIDMGVISNPAKQRVTDDAIGNAVDFWRDGPTQSEGTGFHDGLLITIFVVKKDPGMALEDFAIENSKSGMGEPISYPVSKIEVNSIKGYQSLVQGFGKTLYIFLPYKNTSDRVLKMYIFSEGKYKSLYDKEYREMLKTFKFTSG